MPSEPFARVEIKDGWASVVVGDGWHLRTLNTERWVNLPDVQEMANSREISWLNKAFDSRVREAVEAKDREIEKLENEIQRVVAERDALRLELQDAKEDTREAVKALAERVEELKASLKNAETFKDGYFRLSKKIDDAENRAKTLPLIYPDSDVREAVKEALERAADVLNSEWDGNINHFVSDCQKRIRALIPAEGKAEGGKGNG